MEDERISKLEEADKHLERCNISSYNLTVDEFSTQVWATSVAKVDLVVSAVDKDIPDDVIKSITSFCNRVIKSDSYVFLIVTEGQFITLRSLFRELNFKVMDTSFKILYDRSTVSYTHLTLPTILLV